MRSFRVNISGKPYLIEIDDIKQTPIQVRVNGQSYEVEVEWQGAASEATVTPEIIPAQPQSGAISQSAQRLPQPPKPRVSEAEKTTACCVEAPMPGVIIEVNVQVGDRIERGDDLFVLEAMKMRNSIKAPRAGRVAEVLVSAGGKVAYGDGLLNFASSEDEA